MMIFWKRSSKKVAFESTTSSCRGLLVASSNNEYEYSHPVDGGQRTFTKKYSETQPEASS